MKPIKQCIKDRHGDQNMTNYATINRRMWFKYHKQAGITSLLEADLYHLTVNSNKPLAQSVLANDLDANPRNIEQTIKKLVIKGLLRCRKAGIRGTIFLWDGLHHKLSKLFDADPDRWDYGGVDYSPTDQGVDQEIDIPPIERSDIPPIERSDIPPIERSITKEVLKESFKKPAQESSLCEQKPEPSIYNLNSVLPQHVKSWLGKLTMSRLCFVARPNALEAARLASNVDHEVAQTETARYVNSLLCQNSSRNVAPSPYSLPLPSGVAYKNALGGDLVASPGELHYTLPTGTSLALAYQRRSYSLYHP